MAKAPVIEEAQMRHAFKVAAVTGQTPAREVALLHVILRQKPFAMATRLIWGESSRGSSERRRYGR